MRFILHGIVKEEKLAGFIEASTIIDNWSPKVFFPFYQRDRIPNKGKINALKSIFKSKLPIDSLTLNLVGDYKEAKSGIILDGDIHIIDGQQRAWAALEANVRDYLLPVQIHYNLNMQEEIALFEQLQKGTKLSFGEQAKTCVGPFADMFRSVVNDKRYPIKILIRKNSTGISASVYCILLHWVYYRMKGSRMKSSNRGMDLLKFIGSDVPVSDTQMSAFGVRSVFNNFVHLFGSFSNFSMAYRRGFLLPWCHVVIDNFMNNKGHLDFGPFAPRLKSLSTVLLNNSRFKELVSSAGSGEQILVYNEIIKYFNMKRRQNRLPEISNTDKTIVTEPDDLIDEE